MAIRNPSKIATRNIDKERGRHEKSADPEAPVAMHAPPVRPGIGFPALTTMSFRVVLVSCHLVSISGGLPTMLLLYVQDSAKPLERGLKSSTFDARSLSNWTQVSYDRARFPCLGIPRRQIPTPRYERYRRSWDAGYVRDDSFSPYQAFTGETDSIFTSMKRQRS